MLALYFVDDAGGGSGNATDTRPFADPKVIVNLSVWQNVDALKRFSRLTGRVASVLGDGNVTASPPGARRYGFDPWRYPA